MTAYLAGRPRFRYHRFESAGGSSSGRTLDSGSRYEGSNPSPPAIFFLATLSGPVDLPAVEILYNVRLSQNAWRIRLARFRTPPSQGGNRGSNPLCATTPYLKPFVYIADRPKHCPKLSKAVVLFMAENKWEMARQDYLLAKQLQGLASVPWMITTTTLVGCSVTSKHTT